MCNKKTKPMNIDDMQKPVIAEITELIRELKKVATDAIREKSLIELKMYSAKSILSRKNLSPNKKVSFLKTLLDITE